MTTSTAHIKDYADRIKGAASHDRWPSKMTAIEAQLLTSRYGLDMTFAPGVWSLSDVATKIATELLKGQP